MSFFWFYTWGLAMFGVGVIVGIVLEPKLFFATGRLLAWMKKQEWDKRKNQSIAYEQPLTEDWVHSPCGHFIHPSPKNMPGHGWPKEERIPTIKLRVPE